MQAVGIGIGQDADLVVAQVVEVGVSGIDAEDGAPRPAIEIVASSSGPITRQCYRRTPSKVLKKVMWNTMWKACGKTCFLLDAALWVV